MKEKQEEQESIEICKKDTIEMIFEMSNERFIRMIHAYVKSAYNEEKAEG